MLIYSLINAKNLRKDLAILKRDNKLFVRVTASVAMTSTGAILFYEALTMLPVSIIGVIENSFQIIATMIIGLLVFKTKVKRKNLILGLLMIPANTLIVFTDFSFDSNVSLLGVSLMIINTTLYALDTFITKGVLNTISVNTLVLFKTGTVFFMAFIISCFSDLKLWETLPTLSLYVVSIVVVAALASFSSNISYVTSIKKIGPNLTAVLSSLTQVFTVAFGIFFFNEVIQITQWIGLISTIILTVMIAYNNRT